MATYTIVSSTKSPLDPGEINAGSNVTPADGDIFFIDPTADALINFVDGGGGPISFDVQIAGTNTNAFNINFGSGLNPTLTISDSVDISTVNLNAASADSFTLTAGNSVDIGKITGSGSGIDTVTIGNGFTTIEDMNFANGDLVLPWVMMLPSRICSAVRIAMISQLATGLILSKSIKAPAPTQFLLATMSQVQKYRADQEMTCSFSAQMPTLRTRLTARAEPTH